MCNVTGGHGAPLWRVNGALYLLSELAAGQLLGHSTMGNNIVVEDIVTNDMRNNSMYICVTPTGVVSDPTTLYISGECKT